MYDISHKKMRESAIILLKKSNMEQIIEVNQGEVQVKFNSPTVGKVSFKELGITEDSLVLDGGFLRLVFDLQGIGKYNYYSVPTIEIAYRENVGETHWQCEFNGNTILDKSDHHGNSTILLMDRNRLTSLKQHHENKLIVHGEFPESVHIDTANSFINLFK